MVYGVSEDGVENLNNDLNVLHAVGCLQMGSAEGHVHAAKHVNEPAKKAMVALDKSHAGVMSMVGSATLDTIEREYTDHLVTNTEIHIYNQTTTLLSGHYFEVTPHMTEMEFKRVLWRKAKTLREHKPEGGVHSIMAQALEDYTHRRPQLPVGESYIPSMPGTKHRLHHPVNGASPIQVPQVDSWLSSLISYFPSMPGTKHRLDSPLEVEELRAKLRSVANVGVKLSNTTLAPSRSKTDIERTRESERERSGDTRRSDEPQPLSREEEQYCKRSGIDTQAVLKDGGGEAREAISILSKEAARLDRLSFQHNYDTSVSFLCSSQIVFDTFGCKELSSVANVCQKAFVVTNAVHTVASMTEVGLGAADAINSTMSSFASVASTMHPALQCLRVGCEVYSMLRKRKRNKQQSSAPNPFLELAKMMQSEFKVIRQNQKLILDSVHEVIRLQTQHMQMMERMVMAQTRQLQTSLFEGVFSIRRDVAALLLKQIDISDYQVMERLLETVFCIESVLDDHSIPKMRVFHELKRRNLFPRLEYSLLHLCHPQVNGSSLFKHLTSIQVNSLLENMVKDPALLLSRLSLCSQFLSMDGASLGIPSQLTPNGYAWLESVPTYIEVLQTAPADHHLSRRALYFILQGGENLCDILYQLQGKNGRAVLIDALCRYQSVLSVAFASEDTLTVIEPSVRQLEREVLQASFHSAVVNVPPLRRYMYDGRDLPSGVVRDAQVGCKSVMQQLKARVRTAEKEHKLNYRKKLTVLCKAIGESHRIEDTVGEDDMPLFPIAIYYHKNGEEKNETVAVPLLPIHLKGIDKRLLLAERLGVIETVEFRYSFESEYAKEDPPQTLYIKEQPRYRVSMYVKLPGRPLVEVWNTILQAVSSERDTDTTRNEQIKDWEAMVKQFRSWHPQDHERLKYILRGHRYPDLVACLNQHSHLTIHPFLNALSWMGKVDVAVPGNTTVSDSFLHSVLTGINQKVSNIKQDIMECDIHFSKDKLKTPRGQSKSRFDLMLDMNITANQVVIAAVLSGVVDTEEVIQDAEKTESEVLSLPPSPTLTSSVTPSLPPSSSSSSSPPPPSSSSSSQEGTSLHHTQVREALKGIWSVPLSIESLKYFSTPTALGMCGNELKKRSHLVSFLIKHITQAPLSLFSPPFLPFIETAMSGALQFAHTDIVRRRIESTSNLTRPHNEGNVDLEWVRRVLHKLGGGGGGREDLREEVDVNDKRKKSKL